MNKNLHDTIKNTVIVGAVVAVFLLIIGSYERSTAPEPFDCSQHVGCGTHIIEQFPEGHGR